MAKASNLRMLAPMHALNSLRFLFVLALFLAEPAPGQAQLRGHGGPVRAVAISATGRARCPAGFDSSAIRWSLARNSADQVLRFHDDAVNAVALLKDGRAVTAGADGRIAIWSRGEAAARHRAAGTYRADRRAQLFRPTARRFASAAWDHTVRLWPIAGGAPRVLEGHSQNVNGVAFMPDGKAVVSAAYDSPCGSGRSRRAAHHRDLADAAECRGGSRPTARSRRQARIASCTSSTAGGQVKGEVQASPTPVISLAISPDGRFVAAAGIRGSVAVIERKERKLARTLVGPGLPVWSVAFLPDNRTMLTGGTTAWCRRWDAVTGDHIGAVAMGRRRIRLPAYAGDPGAEVVPRLRGVPHALARRRQPCRADARRDLRAQDRDAAGYNFLRALKQLDIVWTPETVAKLFESGPARTRPAPRCRSSASARSRIARR
jgi:cytochrome c